jgi:HEAT repeat protein
VHIPVNGSHPDAPHPGLAADSCASPLGVFTTDPSLTVRTWDAWLAQATGIPAEAARGRPLTELIPDLASRGLIDPFQEVLSRGVVEILAPAFHRYLIACPPSAGSATFDRMQQRVTIGPLREDDRVIGTIVAIEDVTLRVERERQLAAQLSSLEPEVRLHAAHRLADAAPVEATDPLLSAIGDDDWRVRRTVVKALGRRTTADVLAGVLQALREDHRNFSVLSSAIELLAAGEIDVIAPLLELLRYPDPDLRLQAALVLGERGDARAVPALVEALLDPDENLRFHAIEALGKLKAAAAVEPLAALAESGEFFLAFPALEALSQIGEPSVAPRLALLLTNDLLRGTVAEVLGRFGDEDVVPPLMQLLNEATAPTAVVAAALTNVYDRYEERYRGGEHIAHLVRRTIAATGTQNLLDAVQRVGVDDLPAIAKVLAWLEGRAVERALTRLLGQPSVRSQIVEYLVRHGGRVVELLVEQLQAEDLETRHAAVVGLGRIGDRRATPALLDVLAQDASLTIVTAGALARIGDPLAFEPLLALVGHPDPAVRQVVIAALNSIGHPAMAGRIGPLLRDPEPHVRESAARIAGYFGYRECAAELLASCRDGEVAVRQAAVEHLCFLDDDRVITVLLGALDDPDPGLRAAAVRSLGRLEDARVCPPLRAALLDGDPWVRYFTARALGEQRHAAAIDDLVRVALDDPAGHVRLAGIDALGRIGSAAAVPALAALSAVDDSEAAVAAVQALGNIPHPDVWAPLQTALRAGGDERRTAAVQSIARQGGATAIGLLEWTAAADRSSTVVAAAVQGLAAIAADGSLAAAAVAALIGVAADPARRDAIISALGALPAAMTDHVAQGLHDPRVPVRVVVLQALGRMRRAEASQWLQTALNDEEADVRVAALTELRHLGTRGVQRRIVTLARTDPDPRVRRAALAVLRVASGSESGASADTDAPSGEGC